MNPELKRKLIEALQQALGTIDSLEHEISQMQGMFDDEDGTTAGALQDATDARDVISPLLEDLKSWEPPLVVVTVEGGMVQDVCWDASQSFPDLKLVVVDYDNEGCNLDQSEDGPTQRCSISAQDLTPLDKTIAKDIRLWMETGATRADTDDDPASEA